MNAHYAIKHALSDLVEREKQFTHYDVTKHAHSFTSDNVRHEDVIAHVAVEMDEKDGYYIDTLAVNKNGSRVFAVLYSPDDMYIYQYSPDGIQTDKSLNKDSDVVSKAKTAVASAAATVRKFQGNFTSGLSAKKNTIPSGHSYTTVSPTDGSCCGGGVTSATFSGVNSCCYSPANIREVIIDNRGRVCIPKAFIDRIGKGAGDVVYVQKSSVQGKLVISAIKWSNASCAALTTNQVDCYGNVRVTSKSLSKCNVNKISKNGSEYVKVRSESDHIVIE